MTTYNVRSHRGRGGNCKLVTHSNAKGCIRAKGVERDVAFEESDDPDHDAIAQAYRSEYARYRHQVALSCR